MNCGVRCAFELYPAEPLFQPDRTKPGKRREAARIEIEEGLRLFFSGHYQVTAQRAGVRPVTRADNRPVAGLHPQHRRLAILNGLGSKGALQAPFAARQLIAKMEDNRDICPEIDACREFLWKQRRSA